MLAWTPDTIDPEVFHITHVDNLLGIIAAGGLRCDAHMAQQLSAPTTIGDPSMKQRRLTWQLNLTGAGVVGDYVPFYFCPRSVMLYRVHAGHAGWSGGQGEVVHMVSRVSSFPDQRCVFTDANAATSYHNAGWTLGSITLQWQALRETRWGGTDRSDIKQARQAEFLVPGFAAWTAFERIVCMTDAARRHVIAALQAAQHQPIVEVDRTWYY